jgi:hypothetical protein
MADDRADPAAHVEAILVLLHAGGATDLQSTTNPLWVIGLAPSGQALQLVWQPEREAYHVSRLVPGQAVDEVLGTFPDWEAAVACALGA